MDVQLRKLQSSAECMAEYRRGLAGQTGQLGRALGILSHCEADSQLKGALAQLSGVQVFELP